jgi:hypothetical protein
MTDARKIGLNEVVEFSIDMDGGRVICWISYEALSDHFGARGDAAMVGALLSNMDRITPVAERIARRTAKGERILVRTQDI